MKEYNVPACIVGFITNRDIGDKEYYLYGCGRAIAFVRMAADVLESLGNRQKTAEYHAYVGISGARTAIDAAANWLRIHLDAPVGQPLFCDFAKRWFLRKLGQKKPEIKSYIKTLGALAKEIDPLRQRAQHREGLTLIFHTPGGWHLAGGLQASRGEDKRLPTLLRVWADEIENNVCEMIQILDQ